jgi:hypothetical protein
VVTCLLVWLSLQWFGIDTRTFHVGREEKKREKQEQAKKKDEIKRKNEKEEEQSDTSKSSGVKKWSERLTWRRKKSTHAPKDAEQA